MGKKKQTNRFKVHAVMDFSEGNRLELMFNSNLEKVTVRAVRDGVIQRPYSKSEVFTDEQGAFFIIGGELENAEMQYVKIYLDNFKRVRGN